MHVFVSDGDGDQSCQIDDHETNEEKELIGLERQWHPIKSNSWVSDNCSYLTLEDVGEGCHHDQVDEVAHGHGDEVQSLHHCLHALGGLDSDVSRNSTINYQLQEREAYLSEEELHAGEGEEHFSRHHHHVLRYQPPHRNGVRGHHHLHRRQESVLVVILQSAKKAVALVLDSQSRVGLLARTPRANFITRENARVDN